MTRLVYVATHPITVFRLMDGQLRFMRERGYDVTVISSPGPLLERAAAREGVRAIGVPMRREMAPVADLVSLARLSATLRALQPDIVNAGTPKAGLLGTMAARACGVPVIIYLLRGLRFEGARGLPRVLLAGAEHVAAGMADRVFANSESLRDRFVALGCAARAKTWVPHLGSSNGIDVERFAVDPEDREDALSRRRALGFPDDAFVVGFVGRFTRDKGIGELLAAFQQAAHLNARLRLLMVGDHDDTDSLPAGVRRDLANDPRIVVTGFVDEPAQHYALMDLFAFTSLREGFPNAPLEAAAAGLPVVAFRAVGTVDAVVDGQTGSILPVGDVEGLARSMLSYAANPARGLGEGQAGLARARAHFQREVVWEAIHGEYQRLLGALDADGVR